MDQNKNEAENLNDQENREENDDLIISIQEMIEDARARRHHKVSEFSCEQCGYKSTSKTLMNNHTGTNHNQKENKIATVNTDTNSFNTRKRFSCDNCGFKTTNENVLKMY